MNPLSLLAALRMARYLGRRIDRKLTYHSGNCKKPTSCHHAKHWRILYGYVYLMGEAGVLENAMEEALEAVGVA